MQDGKKSRMKKKKKRPNDLKHFLAFPKMIFKKHLEWDDYQKGFFVFFS